MKPTKYISLLLLITTVLTIVGCKSEVTNKQMNLTIDGIERPVIYTGEVADNKPNGHGKMIGTNSQGQDWVYEGDVKQGILSGKGKITYQNGITQEGTFENNDFVDGKITNLKGDVIYEGKVKYGRPDRTPVALGEENHYDNWDYTITNVRKASNIQGKPAQAEFIIVDLMVKNNGTKPRSFALANNKYMLVSNYTGKSYLMNMQAMQDLKISQNAKDWYLSVLNPTESASISLVFDIPKTETELMLWPENGIWTATPSALDKM